MAFVLTPEKFLASKNATDVEKAMKLDVSKLGKTKVEYVMASDVKVGARKIAMFVVTDQVKAWQDAFAKLQATKVATGECKAVSDKPFTLAIMSANGDTKANVVKRANGALGQKVMDFALHLAAASRSQARIEGKIDYYPTEQDLSVMLKASLELTEYKKFADDFQKLADKYNMTDARKVPAGIWGAMLKGLRDSQYLTEKIPTTAPNSRDFVLAYSGPGGKLVREKMLAQAMTGLNAFAKHAGDYLDKVVAEIKRAGSNPTWSFWSGDGSMDAAKATNTGGVVLEGSVGSWFEHVWNFEPFAPGISSLALWTSLSELYAQKAAEYYDVFTFNGYVGRGATRDQSVFNKIEQPTFLKVLKVSKKVDAPSITWFVVDSVDSGAPKWKWDGNAPTKAASRDDALKTITSKYGG